MNADDKVALGAALTSWVANISMQNLSHICTNVAEEHKMSCAHACKQHTSCSRYEGDHMFWMESVGDAGLP